jgi:serine/threonine protein kinase
MGLISGMKLGPYEVQSPLGVGGMGEVYRASDTKLKREVALKILPEAFARNAGVMELVPGPTLAERIATGPIR